MIENIFALAVALHIGWGDSRKPAFRIVDRYGQRLPPGLGGCASRSLENRKKGVAYKGIAASGAAIPCGRVEVGDATGKPRQDRAVGPVSLHVLRVPAFRR